MVSQPWHGRSAWPRVAIAVAVSLAVMAGAGLLLLRELEGRAFEAAGREGDAALDLHAEMVRGWLSRFRALSLIYARNDGVLSALRRPDDGELIARTNADLQMWNSAAGSAATYLIDARGVTLASSNWSDAISFVGHDYSFRPYFREAIEGGLGRFFGLGIASGERGYYFSAPIRDDAGVVGVIVVKVGVEELESELQSGAHEVFIEDSLGVIIVARDPALRLTVATPMTAEARRETQASRRYADAPLDPAPIRAIRPAQPGGRPALARLDTPRQGAEGGENLHLFRDLPEEGWRLHLMVSTRGARADVRQSMLLAGSAALLAAMVGVLARQRRRALLARLRERERMQGLLEGRVAERTADLRDAVDRLRAEIAEREKAQAGLLRAQGERDQAARLAALGQMSAALSHEFNQPLTAIRTYAQNAAAFVESGRSDRALDNLGRIARLTERMAQLSRRLVRFARKPDDTLEPVLLAAVIEEAVELMRARLDRSEAVLRISGDADVAVMGGQVRLQHVLMNLLSNAIDAARQGEPPEIDVRVARVEGAVSLVVEDAGQGIAAEAMPRIFEPFFTTKDVGRGLGLGLSICFNIVRDFGGALSAENRPEGGARFTVTLRAAAAADRTAAE